jgi:hypothetical protein
MEEWLRRGPNKRMAPNWRTKCRQTRYPDPKLSPLHEIGASPLHEIGASPSFLKLLRERYPGLPEAE